MRPDQDSFVELQFRTYYQELMSAAVASLKDPFLAEDLVHDTFHALMNQVDKLENHPDIRGWLYKTLLNRLKWHYRDQKIYNELFLSMSSDFQSEPGAPDERLDKVGLDWKEDLERVRQGISQEDFHFFKRQVLEKASYAELAQEMDTTIYALKKRRERLIKKLHKIYPDILDKLR